MEKCIDEIGGRINSVELEESTDAFNSYYELESKLIEILNIQVEKLYISSIDKIDNNEKWYFSNDNTKKKSVNWIFNINHTVTNRGDVSSSSMQKFFHIIFKTEQELISEKNIESNTENIENIKATIKTQFNKFKNSYIENFNQDLISTLKGENIIIDNIDLDKYIWKFEIKNGFFNIFLKDCGKNLIEKIKNNKDKNEKRDNFGNDEQFVVIK